MIWNSKRNTPEFQNSSVRLNACSFGTWITWFGYSKILQRHQGLETFWNSLPRYKLARLTCKKKCSKSADIVDEYTIRGECEFVEPGLWIHNVWKGIRWHHSHPPWAGKSRNGAFARSYSGESAAELKITEESQAGSRQAGTAPVWTRLSCWRICQLARGVAFEGTMLHHCKH